MTDAEWLQLLYDSMATRSVTQRIVGGGDDGRIQAANGGALPFPDSYAGFPSFKSFVDAINAIGTTGDGNDPLFFTKGVDTQAAWNWVGARTGHTATGTTVRCSDAFGIVLRESTRTWQVMYKGARLQGVDWLNTTNLGNWGVDQDLVTDPLATIVQPSGGTSYEMWPYPTEPNANNVVEFYGGIDRAAIADMRCWCIGYKVQLIGADKANARFVGTAGIDHYRSLPAGNNSNRSWPSGIPRFVSDSGGGEWKDIRTDGAEQWIVAIGCFPISISQVLRPPWGNYTGQWPYADPPANGPTWAEILANPPPNPDNGFQQPGTGGENPPGSSMTAFVTSAALTAALNAGNAAPLYAKDPAYIDNLIATIGSNPRRRVLWNGVECFNATVSGSMTRSGSQLLVPAVTANASATINVAANSGIHRVEKASDSAVYIESVVGNGESDSPGKIGANFTSGQPATLAQAILNGPGLDPLTSYIDVMVDQMRANTVVLAGAADRDTMKGGYIVSGGDLRSVALPSWWGGNSFAATQDYWTFMLPWYVVWDILGHGSNLNARLAVRRLRLRVLTTDAPTQWVELSEDAAPAGDSFARDLVTAGADASGRLEADGTYSARVEPNGGIFHGYGGGTSDFDPSTLIAVQTIIDFRKIKQLDSGPDDRAAARYAIQVGLDAYPYAGATPSELGASYNPGLGGSRWIEATNDWQTVAFSSIDSSRTIDTNAAYNSKQYITEAAFRATPPPAP